MARSRAAQRLADDIASYRKAHPLHDEAVGLMTNPPNGVIHELDHLAESGSEVFFRKPESMDLLRLMDPSAVPDALAMGRRQAEGDAEALRSFLDLG